MDQFTQDRRLISIETPLAKDRLLLTDFTGTEYISDLFEFHLKALSPDAEIKPEELVGKPVNVKVHHQDKSVRVFNGYINQFSSGASQHHGLHEYRFTLVPWLWFLEKTQGCRIFQNKTAKEIISQVMSARGFNDFEFRAEGGPAREYCVQYGESDFNFVSRLMEEEGMAYFFKHEAKQHRLIVVDKANAYDECAQTGLVYTTGPQPQPHLSAWAHAYAFRTGRWTLSDYNFKEPGRNLVSGTPTVSKFANAKGFEHYGYADLYDLGLGDALVKKRMEMEEVGLNRVQGEGNCSGFYAGGTFSVSEHAVKAEKGRYLLTAVEHRAHDHSYFPDQGTASVYRNAFTCIPAAVPYRPQRRAVKPRMPGPQSALVTGPAGEEIYIDEYGRIKVQFIWDREGQKDDHSSCFLRVMQSWAGHHWGASFIPRMGQEVIVTFLDGDPDRPIVSGAVYNGANKPVYPHKTHSGIKTRSTKGGGPENCNELRFDDQKGAEQIFIHAERNLDTEVEHDETHTVDNDRTKTVKHDEHSTINHDRNKTVDNNQTEKIGKNKTITVGENHKESIGKNKDLDVGQDHTESIGKNMTISIGKNLTESVDGAYTETVTKDYSLRAKTITMQADDKITLKTGSAMIVMKSNGDITISGSNINVKGSGNIIIKGSKVTTN